MASVSLFKRFITALSLYVVVTLSYFMMDALDLKLLHYKSKLRAYAESELSADYIETIIKVLPGLSVFSFLLMPTLCG
jgi:hypothetical protein